MAATKTGKRKQTYKLMQWVMITDENGATAGKDKYPIAVGKREYLTVETGKTWKQAQEMRRKDTSLIIVKEARVYKTRAKRVKKVAEEASVS